MVKITKVSFTDWRNDREEIVLFENNKIRDEPIKREESIFDKNKRNPQEEVSKEVILTVDFHFKLGKRIFKRGYKEIKCPKREREILNIKKQDEGRTFSFTKVTYLLERKDFEYSLIREIKKQEKEFYLDESELIEEAYDLIKKKSNWNHFRTQVEIGGCIADGLAFIGDREDHTAKIIGFEVKSNKDNYTRLYNQLNAYLSFCDEVYMVVEKKEPPKDLPFYVGIIKIENSKGRLVRPAQNLKHSIDVNEFWLGLLKNLNTHIGLKRETEIKDFFEFVETIKRKLIWNQFVIGYNKKWSKDYIGLNDNEKKVIRSYFGKESDTILERYMG